jgi:hypothetical protein
MPTWSGLRLSRLLLVLAAAACASPEEPAERPGREEARGTLGALPASFANTPSCGGCLALTLTLRPDGAYTVRERVGSSEFYDFGAWRESRGVLRLSGGRDAARRYGIGADGTLEALKGTPGGELRRTGAVEALRGPFRMVGLYNGALFKECRTGLAWPLEETRAAEALDRERGLRQSETVLVALDASFAPRPGGEALRVLRTASILNQRGCPG